MIRGKLLADVDLHRIRSGDELPDVLEGWAEQDAGGTWCVPAFKRGRPAGDDRWRALTKDVTYGRDSQAECAGSRCDGPTPNPGCRCGFYAVSEPREIPYPDGVVLEVAFTGRVLIYEFRRRPRPFSEADEPEVYLAIGERQHVIRELADEDGLLSPSSRLRNRRDGYGGVRASADRPRSPLSPTTPRRLPLPTLNEHDLEIVATPLDERLWRSRDRHSRQDLDRTSFTGTSPLAGVGLG